MWDKCAQYLRKMGGMILIASIIVWFLSYYPREDAGRGEVANYEYSYLGRIGKACEPVFTPLGLNWKSGVALLSGISAKEIVVSTLGVLYAGEEPEDRSRAAVAADPENTAAVAGFRKPALRTTRRKIRPAENTSSASGCLPAATLRRPRHSGCLSSFCFTSPCIATVSAIGSEAGWRWAAASGRLQYGRGLDRVVGGLSPGIALLTMEWQEIVVGIVVAAAFAEALRRLSGCFRRGRGGCASCTTANCPLKKMKK